MPNTIVKMKYFALMFVVFTVKGKSNNIICMGSICVSVVACKVSSHVADLTWSEIPLISCPKHSQAHYIFKLHCLSLLPRTHQGPRNRGPGTMPPCFYQINFSVGKMYDVQ